MFLLRSFLKIKPGRDACAENPVDPLNPPEDRNDNAESDERKQKITNEDGLENSSQSERIMKKDNGTVQEEVVEMIPMTSQGLSRSLTHQPKVKSTRNKGSKSKSTKAAHPVSSLTGIKPHSQTLRGQIGHSLQSSVNMVSSFLGTGPEADGNMSKWKKKWDKEVGKGHVALANTMGLKHNKDVILNKLEKTVQQLTDDTEVDNSKLLEQIASEDTLGPLYFYNPHATDVVQQLHHISSHQMPSTGKTPEENVLRHRMSSDTELVYGHEAYEQYKMLVQLEKQDIMKKLKLKKEVALAKLTWQERMLDNVRHLATEYYRNPTGQAAKDWKALRLEVKQSEFTQSLGLQTKLAEIPTYFPFFTYLIILAQLTSFVVIVCLGGVTTVGTEPKSVVSKPFISFTGLEKTERWIIPNLWIGPDYKFFIGIGAVYAPCLRTDFLRVHEYLSHNYTQDIELGCCEIVKRNVAGTTTERECEEWTVYGGNWTKGMLCSKRPSGLNSVAHEIRPCCAGSRGQCIMVTHAHCSFIGGTRSANWEHCSLVNCLSSVCGMGGVKSDAVLKWKADSPNQWWRFLLSPLFHPGIIQCGLVLIGQLLLMRQLEAIAGWLRVLIIYVTCCFSSYAAAAGFEPYMPHMGGAGALSGVIGVSFIEMLQSWPLIEKPWKELLKFCGIIFFLLMSGTLPFLNNYGLVIGFITGILTGIIILPYITFGKWSAMCRRLLLVIALPLLLILYILVFFIMYRMQIHDCASCDSFNCVQYTPNICKYVYLTDRINIYEMHDE